MGKAFENKQKQLKIKEKNQIKAIQNQGQVKTITKYVYNDENSPLISKQKEIVNKLADERLKDITKTDKKVNCDDLINRSKGLNDDVKCDEFHNALNLLDKIIEGKKA